MKKFCLGPICNAFERLGGACMCAKKLGKYKIIPKDLSCVIVCAQMLPLKRPVVHLYRSWIMQQNNLPLRVKYSYSCLGGSRFNNVLLTMSTEYYEVGHKQKGNVIPCQVLGAIVLMCCLHSRSIVHT